RSGAHRGQRRERRRRSRGRSGPAGARPRRFPAGLPAPDLPDDRRPHRRRRRPFAPRRAVRLDARGERLRMDVAAARTARLAGCLLLRGGGRARDLSGLPPAYIACGALDLFVEENLDYARRLIRAGVPTELHVYPGAPHGFQMVAEADVSRQAVRDSFTALGRLLAAT